jgi:hypothetical protein
MLQRPLAKRDEREDRFVAVTPPAESEGVGRALQTAFRDGFELPDAWRATLAELDRISY